MQERARNLEKKQSAKAKKSRILHKAACVEEQQEHKQWAKRQRILHQYAIEESNDSDDEMASETPPNIEGQQTRCCGLISHWLMVLGFLLRKAHNPTYHRNNVAMNLYFMFLLINMSTYE